MTACRAELSIQLTLINSGTCKGCELLKTFARKKSPNVKVWQTKLSRIISNVSQPHPGAAAHKSLMERDKNNFHLT